ncbi:MAG TPA: glycoside hydrolase family 6 protein [Propionibacteriaceae bacterium]|nr:glycoside hydrolase family 6 protein [Propionibacteriaceae bacterium]
MSRAGAAGTALGLLLAVTGCAAAVSPEPATVELPANPLAGARLWVDPQSTAQKQADAWRKQGKAEAAAAIEPIAGQPVASWFSGQDDNPYSEAERVTSAAAAQGQLPVLVAYHRPDRDCGSYSAGGSDDESSYLAWVGQLAAGIGDRPAVVILEPDAVAQAVSGACGSTEQGAAAFRMLAKAVDVLKKQPGARVYVDAGHSDWLGELAPLADALRTSGVERADGFSLNVSNFQTTGDSVAYGERLSAALGQRQFVIDVSRNGRGAPAGAEGIDAWCNPPSAALGEDPRVAGDEALAVALLWIKEPGASDGDCRPGEPKAGQFWPDYAERLIDQRP